MYNEFGCCEHLAITSNSFSARTHLIDTNVKLVRFNEYRLKEQIFINQISLYKLDPVLQ